MTYQYQTEFLNALQNPEIYDHPVSEFELIETHISWVLLTGPCAYKIKKPVNLGFVDFSTLEKRHHYCHEELRLNRRLAPTLYLDVVAFNDTPQYPVINGAGQPFEYAVKMVQFPSDARLDHLLQRRQLYPSHIDQLARDVFHFHATVAVAGMDTPWGEPAGIHETVTDNFTMLGQLAIDEEKTDRIEHVRQWSDHTFQQHMEIIQTRKQQGYIRECHGDMHLGNMVLWQDQVTIFDCIEFNHSLNWIDVISELAFLVMDLDKRGRSDLAFRFLNKQLEYSGDYAGLILLNYYMVYRAMVRAKVAGVRLSQTDTGSKQSAAIEAELYSYLSLANRYTKPGKPQLFITHGFSGSGKTWLTQPLLEQLGAIRIRSDIERKRLFELAPNAYSDSTIESGIYNPQASRRVYQRLVESAKIILTSGYPAIVDATFLKQAQRNSFRQLAEQLKVPFTILDFQADSQLLHSRIQHRLQQGKDASEATPAVLEHQQASAEPLTDKERSLTLCIDAEKGTFPFNALHEIYNSTP